MAIRCRLLASYTRRRISGLDNRSFHSSPAIQASSEQAISGRPSIAPKPQIDVRHIRENPALYEKTCVDRNYKALAQNPYEITSLFEEWKELQQQAKGLRERKNEYLRQLGGDSGLPTDQRSEILQSSQELKRHLSVIQEKEDIFQERIQFLAVELPNLTSEHTPIGDTPRVLAYINEHPDLSGQTRNISHADIGTELDILDFAAAGTTSGWGFYYLKNEAALLEQALVQYALKVARDHGFQVVSPPSIVYSHISSACGFRPRDSGGEQQVYTIAKDEEDLFKPELSLAGTAEIPFAAMKASNNMDAGQLPLRVVGSSRCYRAEAGSRGINTKGLYRVHEFTKVEMFGWTMPDGSETTLFELMMSVQKTILKSLGLHCRVLEQPSHDLGASASRKQDIEAFFPSRRKRDSGWGEVTSTSICTDYQTRRLATKVSLNGKPVYPYTVNGTALAVPRVLAAILENHWDATRKIVHIPQVLQPWMDGKAIIGSG